MSLSCEKEITINVKSAFVLIFDEGSEWVFSTNAG